jgi:hypothetical protein
VTAPQPPGDWRPIPDPTRLTAEAVANAEAGLRREIGNQIEIIRARLDAMDNARALLLQIMDERSAEIERRFGERDLRFTERDVARQEAVRTALDAAKELSDARDAAADRAIAKFEISVREQISQIGELAASGRDQLDTQIRALEKRLDRGEGASTGAADTRSERRLDTGLNYTAASVLIGFLILAVALYAALHH